MSIARKIKVCFAVLIVMPRLIRFVWHSRRLRHRNLKAALIATEILEKRLKEIRLINKEIEQNLIARSGRAVMKVGDRLSVLDTNKRYDH